MFCPRCGVRNVEDAKYCRACGADISLVPQALTRSLPDAASDVENFKEAVEARRKRKKKEKEKEPPTLDKGLAKCMEGVAFLLIVLIGFFYFWGGIMLWIWFIIPALSNFGEGVGQIIRSRREHDALPPPQTPYRADELPPPHAPAAGLLAPRETAEIPAPPVSVTEGTTRHLDAAGPAKH